MKKLDSSSLKPKAKAKPRVTHPRVTKAKAVEPVLEVIERSESLPVFPPITSERSDDGKRALMWVGVAATMTMIVVGWGLSFKYSLNAAAVPASKQVVLPELQTEELKKMFENVNQQLDGLKKASATAATLAQPTQPTEAPSLTPEQLEALKLKLQEAEKASEAVQLKP